MSTDWLLDKGVAQLALAEVLAMAGRGDDAEVVLRRARNTFELKGASSWAAAVHALPQGAMHASGGGPRPPLA
jgi:hypothetical protein